MLVFQPQVLGVLAQWLTPACLTGEVFVFQPQVLGSGSTVADYSLPDREGVCISATCIGECEYMWPGLETFTQLGHDWGTL